MTEKRVLLTIEETRVFKIVLEGMQSLEEAKTSFDPCEDLDGEIPVDGSYAVSDAKEVIDCPDCEAKGFTKPGYHNCPKCGGKGYVIPEPEKKPVVKFYHNLVEESGLWHLFEIGSSTCRCGKSSAGENHGKIPIERRNLCWECHKDMM